MIAITKWLLKHSAVTLRCDLQILSYPAPDAEGTTPTQPEKGKKPEKKVCYVSEGCQVTAQF